MSVEVVDKLAEGKVKSCVFQNTQASQTKLT